ncbi:hypothetical protein NEOLEDRAFT_658419 [Neolentinus lepideus HHB14362 ss-1]|uniref:Uncharacterized protein n=1 Tax=Neolentinus lepideus HHB14362 ss-1 TaxID=1314782 RepID=A0A165QG35_9AGAM|nr:hypothetical protein NEOLEDRAFT_658419 [Neolentinus lepideus HHB14362 ss-1]
MIPTYSGQRNVDVSFVAHPPSSDEVAAALSVLRRTWRAPQIIVEFATPRNICAFGRERLKELGYDRTLSLFKRHFRVDEFTHVALGWEELVDNVARIRIKGLSPHRVWQGLLPSSTKNSTDDYLFDHDS